MKGELALMGAGYLVGAACYWRHLCRHLPDADRFTWASASAVWPFAVLVERLLVRRARVTGAPRGADAGQG